MKLYVTETSRKEVSADEWIKALAPNIQKPKFTIPCVALLKPKNSSFEPTPVLLFGMKWSGTQWTYNAKELLIDGLNTIENLWAEDALMEFPEE